MISDRKLQFSKPVSIPNAALEQEVEAIINRGGSTPGPATKSTARSAEVRKTVIVYFDPKVLNRIDEVRRSLRIKTSRQRWLMEAIMSELDRSGSAAESG